MDVRKNLREIIRDKAFVQAGIARKAGMTPMQLGQALRGNRRLDTDEFLRVCAAVNMLPEDVIYYSALASEEGKEG